LDEGYMIVACAFLIFSGNTAVQPDTVRVQPAGIVGVAEGPDEYQFGRITSIAADRDGVLYVGDQVRSRVQVFDPSGRHVRTIGRQGPGPGEFRFLRQIAVGGHDLFVVSDEGKREFSVLTKNGELVGTAPLTGGAHYFDGIHMDDAGWIYDGRQGWGAYREHSYVVAIRVSERGIAPDSLVIPIPRSETEAIGISGVTGYTGRVEQPLSIRTLWTVLPDGTVAATNGARCEIELRNASGEHRTVRCETPRHRATARERRDALDTAREEVRHNAELAGVPARPFERQLVPPPAHHPRFFAMTSDPDGQLWALAPVPGSHDLTLVLLAEETEVPVIRLSADQGVVPEGFAVGGEWLYLRSRDELGVDRVVRYRLPIVSGSRQ
jgi:hypothetical protein